MFKSLLVAFGLVLPVVMAEANARELNNIHRDGIWDVEFSPDGQLFATAGGDGVVKIWDAVTLEQISSFVQSTQHFQVYDVHFLADSQRVVAACLGGKPAVWDARTGTLLKVLVGHDENVVRVAHSRDGSLFYTAGSDDYVLAWDTTDYHIVGRYHVKSPVGIVPLDRTGEILVASLAGLQRADVLTGGTEQVMSESPYFFNVVGSRTGMSYAGGQIAEGAAPRAVDAMSGQMGKLYDGMTSGFVWNMAAAEMSPLVSFSEYQGLAVLWNSMTGETVYNSANESWKSLSVTFSPGDAELVVGDTEGSVHFLPLAAAAKAH